MSSSDGQSSIWLERLADGEADAVQQFWDRFGFRMQRLAEKNIGKKLAKRVDAEDVVQSACRTFFRRVGDGKLRVATSDKLWNLMCVIVLLKTRQVARFHFRDKRALSREVPMAPGAEDESDDRFQPTSSEPSPAEAAEFADELNQLLRNLEPEMQQVVQLKLEGYTNGEIGDKLAVSERTVRRHIQDVRQGMKQTLLDLQGQVDDG